MPEPTGIFIEPSDNDGTDTGSREPADSSNDSGVSGSQNTTNDAIGGPETVYGYETISPETIRIGGTDNTGAGARYTKSGRVDRRTKAGRSTAGNEAPQSQSTITDKLSVKELLISIHAGIAVVTGIQEAELDATEADKIARAGIELGKHYSVAFDPKKVAIFNFIVVIMSVYLTRYMAYRLRMKMEAGDKQPPKLTQVPKNDKKVDKAAFTDGRNTRMMNPSDVWPEPAGYVDTIGG